VDVIVYIVVFLVWFRNGEYGSCGGKAFTSYRCDRVQCR